MGTAAEAQMGIRRSRPIELAGVRKHLLVAVRRCQPRGYFLPSENSTTAKLDVAARGGGLQRSTSSTLESSALGLSRRRSCCAGASQMAFAAPPQRIQKSRLDFLVCMNIQ
jgi:hypothetical protein